MTTPLTPTQQAVLDDAHQHGDGKITWTKLNINGGARQKIIGAMLRKKLVTGVGHDYFIAAGGYEAMGLPRRKPITERELDAVTASAERANKPLFRAGTKQAKMIGLLKRPEGATIEQICAATQWLPHTVRGAMAGALTKRLGLAISSTKRDNQIRVYRITN